MSIRHLKYRFLVVTALFCLFAGQSVASHITGGDIAYICNGNGTYDITLNLFRDCDGINLDPTQDIDVISSCGVNTVVTLNLVAVGGLEISQLCANQLPASTCNGGTLPGNEIYTYEATAALPFCNGTYTFSWDACCRNAAATNITNPGGAGLYVETIYNMANDPCDNSPYFENSATAYPLQYVCLGAQYSYNFGVVDPDADALTYSLIAAQTAAATPVGYVAPYSAAIPITGITLDPVTGQVDFTPNIQGNFIVSVQVDSYDAMGNWLGSVTRDIQFVIFPCAGQQMPVLANGGISTFTGTSTLAGPTAIEMCTGDEFCFSLDITDGNANQTLSVSSNVAQALPGATMTVTGVNPITVDVCYTADQFSPDFAAFTLVIADDNCPIPGVITFTVAVTVTDRTYAGPDHTICNGATAPLSAFNGTVFTWSVLSGDTAISTNLSCNPCASPTASPNVTTNYLVTSDFTGGCGNTDTVTVVVPGDIDIVETLSADTVCLNDQVQIDVTAVPGGIYSYAWEPDPQLNTTTGTSVVATMVTPGMNHFPVSLTNPLGCNSEDTIKVFVTASTIPALVFGGNATICEGETTGVSAEFVSAPECVYVLELTDLASDGWFSGSVDVLVDGVLYGNYAAVGAGQEEWLTLPVNATVELVYHVELFGTQVGFSLFDGSGNLVYDAPFNPPGGSVFNGVVQCGDFTYDWSPMTDIVVEAGGDSITVSATQTTTYTVVVENFEGTCRDSATVTVDIASAPSITNVFIENEECVNGNNGILNIALSGGTGPFEYSVDDGVNFQPTGIIGGLSAGSYDILVVDNNDCSTTGDGYVVGPYGPPTVTTDPANNICLGESTQVSADAEGGIENAILTYSWFVNDTAHGGAITPVTVGAGQTAPFTPTGSTMIYVVADDGCNDSVAVDSILVEVYPWPETDFLVSDDYGCAPQEVSFDYTPANPGDVVTWYFSTGDTVQASDDFVYTFENPGSWDVFVAAESEGGCNTLNDYQDIVEIFAVPEAFFYYTPKDPTINESKVDFTNESRGNLAEVTWNFAGLDYAYEDDPSFEFPADTGYYPVNLSVVSTDGCEHDTTLEVYINGEFFFHMPDAFTPNYDGLNDVFAPIGYGVESPRSGFYIYNRWGELVFQTKNALEGWDGTIRGRVAPTGVYVWKLMAPDPFARDPNQTREWTGQVTLLR